MVKKFVCRSRHRYYREQTTDHQCGEGRGKGQCGDRWRKKEATIGLNEIICEKLLKKEAL